MNQKGGRMKKYKLLSQSLIFALIIIAAVVAATIAAGKNAWALIIAYWMVLTVKNAVDLIGSGKGGDENN